MNIEKKVNDTEMPVALFIVSSTRHLVLACAIAESASPCKRNILVISDKFKGSVEAYQALNKLISTGLSPFESVYSFKTQYILNQEESVLKRQWLYLTREIREKQLVLRLIDKYDIAHVLTSETNNVLTQVLINRVLRNRKIICHFIEDGIFSYIEQPVKKLSWDTLLWERIKFGFFIQPPYGAGRAPWVEQCWFLNSNLAYSSLSNEKKINVIKSDWLQTHFLTELSSTMSDLLHYDFKLIQELDVILILDRLKVKVQENKGYMAELQCFVDGLEKGGKKVGFKKHPRDEENINNLNVAEIPKGLPAELLLPYISSETIVIGDVSSVLVDVKILFPSISVFAISYNKGSVSEQALFNNLKIPIFNSYQEVNI